MNGPSTQTRSIVMIRDHGKCEYCGKPATTIDHVLPKTRGGDITDPHNLVACCWDCNTGFGTTLPTNELIQKIIARHAKYKAGRPRDVNTALILFDKTWEPHQWDRKRAPKEIDYWLDYMPLTRLITAIKDTPIKDRSIHAWAALRGELRGIRYQLLDRYDWSTSGDPVVRWNDLKQIPAREYEDNLKTIARLSEDK